ncbi:MAG: hypothetical protein HZB38_00925 [Planctomycetes bacterium]|nr:hypothetical protein [Planctomycetota bacterium]
MRQRHGRFRRGFWFAPAAFGILLIGLGLLIFYNPLMLAYVVGGGFVFIGLVLVSLAAQMRGRVTYQRLGTMFRQPPSGDGD